MRRQGITILSVLLLFLFLGANSLVFISCEPEEEDIMIYVMLEDVRYVDRLVRGYNGVQKRFFVRYKVIAPNKLQAVLENKIERRNLFLVVMRHDIVAKAGKRYLIPIISEYGDEVKKDDFNELAQTAVGVTENFGLPLYFYKLSENNSNGVSVATLTIPIQGVSVEHTEELQDFLRFISLPDMNMEALFLGNAPVYKNVKFNELAKNDQRRVDSTQFSSEYVDDELQPKSEVLRVLH